MADHSIDTRVTFGYYTLFAYLKEFDAGIIPEQNFENYLGINLKCGYLSYCESPTLCEYILGVSGTLFDMHEEMKKYIKNIGINFMSKIPSIFGEGKIDFAKKDNDFMYAGTNQDDQFLKIAEISKKKN